MLLTRDEAKSLCDQALSLTTATDATVSVQSTVGAHARFAGNSVTTSGRAEDLQIRITVWIDRRRGSATTNDSSKASLAAAVAEAERIARVSPVDREYVPTIGAVEYAAVGGFASSTIEPSLPARTRALATVLDTCRKAGVIGAGFHEAQGNQSAFATKNGNFRYFRSTYAALSLTARTSEGTGSGYFGRDHFDLEQIDHVRIAEQAVGKALRSRNARRIEPGSYRVILEPQAASDLLGFFNDTFDARTADEGRSAFSAKEGQTKIGDRLFDERITLYSDPMHAELPGEPFTDEGMAARRVDLVRAGVLANLVYSRFWARETGKEPTPGPVNYIFESSAPPASIDDMVKATDRGLLITRFWYVRLVDARTIVLTGLTRDGVWLIENGQVRYPVGNLRFNQSVLAMLAPGNVEMIGASERLYDWLAPALKLRTFTFTSQSDAV
jgi:predicted Zn-dependent protease